MGYETLLEQIKAVCAWNSLRFVSTWCISVFWAVKSMKWKYLISSWLLLQNINIHAKWKLSHLVFGFSTLVPTKLGKGIFQLWNKKEACLATPSVKPVHRYKIKLLLARYLNVDSINCSQNPKMSLWVDILITFDKVSLWAKGTKIPVEMTLRNLTQINWHNMNINDFLTQDSGFGFGCK